MRRLPDTLRPMLAAPIGPLVKEKDAVKKLKRKRCLLVSVGDTVSYVLLHNNIKPSIIIYDLKNLRVPVPLEVRHVLEKHCKKRTVVKNPAGTITPELEKAVKSALKKKKGNVFVQGEEDLASLVAIMHAPEKAVVVYGQPNQGIVFIEVNKEMKEKAGRFYEEMIVSQH